MEETYNLKAFILSREPFRENDSRISVYSFERGRLDLAARGARKLSSKLSGHIEPLSLAGIMAVRGKQFDYVGSAVVEKSFTRIKNNLAKTMTAGRVAAVVDQAVKNHEPDEAIFAWLAKFLDFLDNTDKGDRINHAYFLAGLLGLTGHAPELCHCRLCGKKIAPTGNFFSPAAGGVIGQECQASARGAKKISESAIKVLRLAAAADLGWLEKIRLAPAASEEIEGLMEDFFRYHI